MPATASCHFWLDTLALAIQVALGFGFVIIVMRYIKINIDPKDLLREIKLLLRGEVKPESLNALSMIMLFLLSILTIFSMSVSTWRNIALSIAGGSVPPTQPFPQAMFGFLLLIFLIGMVWSQYFCMSLKKRLERQRRRR